MVGAQILNYRIVEKLGDGGMGSVYKAVDVMLEREVALKFLRPELAEQPDLVERFRSEAVVLARLTHQNVASLFGLHRHGNDFFMAMEYVPGKTVEALLKQNGRLSVEHAAQVASHVLHALDYAHRHGVVHRDIKAANIIVTPSGNVKVMDFGIARVLGTERRTRVGFVVGTIGYMAPEQIQGLDVDGRTDIYAVGVVLYEMLTGRMPFQGETEYAVMQAQVQQMPVPPRVFADIPVAVETSVMRARAKLPAERYQTAAEFNGVLQAAVRQGTLLPGGSGTFARPADETREFKSDPALLVSVPGAVLPAGTPVPGPRETPVAAAPVTPSPVPQVPAPAVPPAYTPPPFTTYTPPPPPRVATPAAGQPASGAMPAPPPPAAVPPVPPPPSPTSAPVATAPAAVPSAPVVAAARQPPASVPAPRPSTGLPAAVVALLGVLALAVVGTSAFFGWQWWQARQAGASQVADADQAGQNVPQEGDAATPAADAASSQAGDAGTTAAPVETQAGGAAASATGQQAANTAATPPPPAPGRTRRAPAQEPTDTPARVEASPVSAVVDPLPPPVPPVPTPLRPVLPPATFGNVKWMRVERTRIREVDVLMLVTDEEIRLIDRRTRATLTSVPYPQIGSALYSQGKRPRWRVDVGPAPAATAFDDTVRSYHYVAFQGPSQFVLTRVDRDDLVRLRDELAKRSSLSLDMER